jgi:hypothetical protein
MNGMSIGITSSRSAGIILSLRHFCCNSTQRYCKIESRIRGERMKP